jgi:DNA polymerase-3 subunit epsilon
VPLDFTAIDFETANPSNASACSVGLVKVAGGKVVDTAYWLIRPPLGHDEFREWNTKIHGIRPEDVVDALGWVDQLPDLVAFADGDTLVAHNASFDMGVINGACAATEMLTPNFAYACSLQIARKTYSLDSYRLPVAAMAAGFGDFEHHNALADSQACAAIIVHAAKRHEVDSIENLVAATKGKMGAIGAPLVVAGV